MNLMDCSLWPRRCAVVRQHPWLCSCSSVLQSSSVFGAASFQTTLAFVPPWDLRSACKMAVAGLLCLMLLPASHGAPGGATNARPGHAVTVGLDWGTTVARAATAATIEVDVMPFLGRAARGGPFNAYYEALASLGAAFVRFAPWYPNPRVTVPELRPSDCDARTPATNWNSTLLDGVVRDFMAAVCGPNAAAGACARSVVPQLSTMPSWMYVGGTDPATLPEDPWDTPDPFSAYEAGTELVDKTCRQMARYFGRVVGWYTAGGFADECGHFHASPYRYAWYGLSVLNEDEHKLRPGGGVAYTTCFDAIAEEVAKVNPRVVLVGPELINGHPLTYMTHFLNGSNHRHGRAPRIASYHFGTAATGATAATFFADWDAFVAGTVDAIGAAVRRLGAGTELVLNEYIPFVNDWCDCTGVEHLCGGVAFPARCPNWQHNRTAGGDPDLRHAKGVGINRRTVGWNAAAACFAYGFGTLAERGYKYVAQDQLVGGPWPDNEPAVSCMDWQTGQVWGRAPFNNSAPLRGEGGGGALPSPHWTHPFFKDCQIHFRAFGQSEIFSGALSLGQIFFGTSKTSAPLGEGGLGPTPLDHVLFA